MKELKFYKAQENKEGFKRCPLVFGVSIYTAPIFDAPGMPNGILRYSIVGLDEAGEIVAQHSGYVDSFGKTLKWLAESCDGLPIFYFENLSHNYFFVKEILKINFGEPISKFFTNEKSPLFIRFKALEIRDALALAGCKLRKWAEKLNINALNIEYTQNKRERKNYKDVTPEESKINAARALVVAKCVLKTLKSGNYNYFNIPLTYTGFVRQDIQKAGYKAHNKIEEMAADYDVFNKLTKAKAGGYVNAAAWAIGRTLDNIDAYDGTSAYLLHMLTRGFPMAKLLQIKINNWETIKSKANTHAFLLLAELTNGEIKENCYFPYISTEQAEEYELNGGRDIATAGGKITRFKRVKMWLTEIDLLIIEKVYNIENIEIIEAYAAKKNLLPDYIRNEILKRYEEKSDAAMKKPFDLVAYNMAKSHLNSIYGIMAEVPIKDTTGEGKHLTDEEKRRLYGAKITSKRTVNNYAWSLWVTAYQRLLLFNVGLELGLSWVYSDTDSIFSDNEKAEKIIEKVNAYNFKLLNKLYPLKFNDYNADFIGKINKKEHYKKFKVLGAKKYAGVTAEGLQITVSGVNKEKGVEALRGSLENFKPGLIFSKKTSGRMLTSWIEARNIDKATQKEMLKRGFPIYSSIDSEAAIYKISKGYSETPEEFIIIAFEAIATAGTYGLNNE